MLNLNLFLIFDCVLRRLFNLKASLLILRINALDYLKDN